MPPPDRTIPGSSHDWLVRARSSYAIAQAPKPEAAAWEDLCFEAQQSAEKAIKAVLRHRRIVFPFVHDIQNLLELLVQDGGPVPDVIKVAAVLSRYAFQTRYPGDYVPVTEEDYRLAIEQAKTVLDWASGIIEREKQ
jgi:HEPN domain-containing protein